MWRTGQVLDAVDEVLDEKTDILNLTRNSENKKNVCGELNLLGISNCHQFSMEQ